MTPDERLDQLEPLLAETMAILDQHTALHRQTQAQIKQVIGLVGQQSSNISFLLTSHAALQTTVANIQQDVAQLKQDQAELRADVAGLKTDVAGLKTDVAGLKTDVAGFKTELSGVGGKLDLILQVLQNPNK